MTDLTDVSKPTQGEPGLQGVTAAAGFRAAGVTAGLKTSGKPDVALVVNDGPTQPWPPSSPATARRRTR